MKRRNAIAIMALLSATAISSLVGFSMAAFQVSKAVGEDFLVGQKRVIYLDISSSPNWQANNPKFAVWLFEGEDALPDCFANDAFMDSLGDHLYRASVPNGYTKLKFLRYKTEAATPSWDDSDIWNQTNDLLLSTNDIFRVNNTAISGGVDDGKFSGSWSSKTSYVYSYDAS